MEIITSYNLKDYKLILEELIDDFGLSYWPAILTWCKIIDDKVDPNKYWQVRLIQKDNQIIGICGLYSLLPNNNDELWLAWLAILPKHRNSGLGAEVLNWLKKEAKDLGAKKLFSYVSKEGKPLSFYYRNGFVRQGTVQEYMDHNKHCTLDDFQDPEDHVIFCDLTFPNS